jgi:hypothetical protein
MNSLLLTILIVLIIIILYKNRSGFSSKEGFQCDPETGKKIQIRDIDTAKSFGGQARYGGQQCVMDPDAPERKRVSPGENKELGGDYCPVPCVMSDEWELTDVCDNEKNVYMEKQKVAVPAKYGGGCTPGNYRYTETPCRTEDYCNGLGYSPTDDWNDCDPDTGKVWEYMESGDPKDAELCGIPLKKPSSQPCEACIYTDWAPAECDINTGKRIERRGIKFAGAYGPDGCAGSETIERKRLTTEICGTPVDCVTSNWVNSGSCSSTGKQLQTRTIITPAQYGGTCPSLSQTIDCPVNCAVSSWSTWGTCDPITGLQTRTRTITQQPLNGGTACPVLSETQPCRVDCGYGAPWTLTNICNSSTGKKYETNTVITQPKNGGTACITDLTSSVRRRDATTSCDPVPCILGSYNLVNSCTTDDFLNEEMDTITPALYGGSCNTGLRKSTFKCNLTAPNAPLLPTIKGVKTITFNKPTGDQIFHIQQVTCYISNGTTAVALSSTQLSASYNKPLSLGGGTFAAANAIDANSNTYTAVDPSQGVTTLTLTLTNPANLIFVDVVNIYNPGNTTLTALHTWSRLAGTVVNMFDAMGNPLKTFTLTRDYLQRIGLIRSGNIISTSMWVRKSVKFIVFVKPYNSTLSAAENSFRITDISAITSSNIAIASTDWTASYISSLSLLPVQATVTNITTPVGADSPANILDGSITTSTGTDTAVTNTSSSIGISVSLTTPQLINSITIINSQNTALQPRLSGVIMYLLNQYGRAMTSYTLTGAASQTISNIQSSFT